MQLNLEVDGQYSFSDLEMSIVNPFYDSTGRVEVNPIEEYKKEFLESNFINLLDKVKKYLGQEPSVEKKNMCIAINFAEIQEYVVNEYIKLFEEENYSVEDVINEFSDDCFICLKKDDKIILNPFKDEKLLDEYKDLYYESKLSHLL